MSPMISCIVLVKFCRICHTCHRGVDIRNILFKVICIYGLPIDTDNSVVKALGGVGGGDKWGEKGDSCNTLNNKDILKNNKEKIFLKYYFRCKFEIN